MTLASDQNTNRTNLSTTAQRMLALREDVFAAWEKCVREHLDQAQVLQQPILVDTLPVFYDNIAESISPDYPRISAVDGSTVAAEHGGERARITAYNHTTLIEEYQILRWAIFHTLQQSGAILSYDESRIINSSIDSGIQQAVEAFSLVQSGLRERFAAALTHDLRGPLSTISNALELILLSKDPARIKAVAAKALSNAGRMDGMIAELLDTMTFHGGQVVQLDISNVDVCELLKEIQVDAQAEHSPRIHVTCQPVRGWWDRSALKRAIENLVSNAVKYGTPNTPITIKSNEIYGRLVLSVHNEGAPIPPSEQECIFQMYRRTDSAKNQTKQGWGIGLPYVRAITESHGGSIGVDSAAERGTSFLIDIPVDSRLTPNAPTLAT